MRRSHFDLLAPFYDRVIHPVDLAELRRLARLPCTGRLLDAGGGTGRIASGLAGTADRILVVDESLAMLAQARQKRGLGLVAGRTEQLPFKTDSFARVVMVDAFHHLADQGVSLAELWRIVEPGGRIVIEEPDISRLAVRLVAFFERLARMRSRFLPAATIAAMAKHHGARASTHRRDHTVWVVAEKLREQRENPSSRDAGSETTT